MVSHSRSCAEITGKPPHLLFFQPKQRRVLAYARRTRKPTVLEPRPALFSLLREVPPAPTARQRVQWRHAVSRITTVLLCPWHRTQRLLSSVLRDMRLWHHSESAQNHIARGTCGALLLRALYMWDYRWNIERRNETIYTVTLGCKE